MILPVWNGAPYISEAIDSILSQSVTDFELIVIDDGSTDATHGIVESRARGDSRIRFVSRPNRGLVITLNEGIDLARGQWIARMDADDVALPERFKRQLTWLEQSGADMAGSWVRRFGSNDNRVVRFPLSDDAIKAEMLLRCPFAHPTIVIRADILRGFRYDPSWAKVEDYELWTRLAEAGVKMTNVPEVLLRYRVHDAQVSTAHMHEQANRSVSASRQHWHRIHSSFQLGADAMEPILNIVQGNLRPLDMDAVDNTLVGLLGQAEGEAKKVIIQTALRAHIGVASVCPDVARRWSTLCRVTGGRATFKELMLLSVLALFRIRQDGTIFGVLRRLKNLLADTG